MSEYISFSLMDCSERNIITDSIFHYFVKKTGRHFEKLNILFYYNSYDFMTAFYIISKLFQY